MTCPSSINVLLWGSGGREHALAWKLRQSPRLGTLWLAEHNENAGLLRFGRETPVGEVDIRNPFRMQRWCDRESIGLVVIGPEAPLAAGLADAIAAPHRRVFGPSQRAAQLEADKAFAKGIMRAASIPSAEGRVFEDVDSARRFVEARDQPWVVKATGLASGKGVIVCDDVPQALAALQRIMVDREFGDAGATVLIEERLHGPEASVLALVDGATLWVLDPCQDHKRLGEGDVGPNTGGMGAYCPAPVLDADALAAVQRQVLVPAVNGLARDGIVYRGVLYAGLMLTPAGPKVLEFNCRFGDPECQTLMPRLVGDLVEILWATAGGELDATSLSFDPRTCCCVVMASGGYPGPYRKGVAIEGLDEAGQLVNRSELLGPEEELIVFHAGTRRDPNGKLVTNGGRVLGVTALAADLPRARAIANAACGRIRFDGAVWRRDIGVEAGERSGTRSPIPG